MFLWTSLLGTALGLTQLLLVTGEYHVLVTHPHAPARQPAQPLAPPAHSPTHLPTHPPAHSPTHLPTHPPTRPFDAGLNRQLGLSDQLFALGDSAVLTVLGQVSFMPVLVLAARLCPEVGLGVVGAGVCVCAGGPRAQGRGARLCALCAPPLLRVHTCANPPCTHARTHARECPRPHTHVYRGWRPRCLPR